LFHVNTKKLRVMHHPHMLRNIRSNEAILNPDSVYHIKWRTWVVVRDSDRLFYMYTTTFTIYNTDINTILYITGTMVDSNNTI